MLITPAAMPYESMGEDDIVWLPLAAADVPAVPADTRRPSSEWRIHRDIYVGREDADAVVHVHSPAATALACLPRVQQAGIPAFHYMIAVAGGPDIRCAPYRTFGTQELSEVALVALHGRRACLLANHGTVALGNTLAQALELSVEVESLARMYAQAMQLGEPVVLPDEEIRRVLALFAEYRASDEVASVGPGARAGPEAGAGAEKNNP
jgi:L-fuculose-phosphate aldolase